VRRLRDWAARHGGALADYADPAPDPFANINTPAEHAAAEAGMA
jgi:molybdopterin-guanine dinucleotide biosynthesis protein A